MRPTAGIGRQTPGANWSNHVGSCHASAIHIPWTVSQPCLAPSVADARSSGAPAPLHRSAVQEEPRSVANAKLGLEDDSPADVRIFFSEIGATNAAINATSAE